MKSFLTRRVVLIATTTVAGIGLALAWQFGRITLRPVAMQTGWLLLALLLALTFFNARKKLPFIPLLGASAWLQAHIYLGWLACVVFLLHIGFRVPDGPVELPLALVFLIVAESGVFGLWLSRWLPPRLTRSGESLVYERIPVLRHRLQMEVKEIVRSAEIETQSTTLADFYVGMLAGYFAHVPGLLAPLTDGDPRHHRVNLELAGLRRFLNARESAIADQLAELIEAKRNLDTQLAGQRLLKLWLFLHIPLTFVLLVFTAAHVWLVLNYSHR